MDAPAPEVEALAREGLAHLDALHAAGGALSERTAEALCLIVQARHPDVPAMLAAADEGMALLDREEASADGRQELEAARLCRARFTNEVVGLLDGNLLDEPAFLAWLSAAETAAAALGDYLFVALQRRSGRVRSLLERGAPRQARAEAEACWRTLGPAVRAGLGTGDRDDRESLRSAARRLAEWAARAAEATGEPDAAAAWRAEVPER